MKLQSLFLAACAALSHSATAAVLEQAPLVDNHPTLSIATPSAKQILPAPLSSELLQLHKSLVEIESISKHEEKVGKWLAAYLQAKGFSVELQEAADKRYNVYAWTGDKGAAKVLVSSHIDTVPPFIPYSFSNGTISGRGTVDAKGSVAAQIIAVLDVLESYKASSLSAPPIALLFVVDEEHGGLGMRFFSDSALNRNDYDAVIFGEPTEGKLCGGHKGITMFTVNVTGRAAHSGYPWLGLSANDVLVQALAKIKALEASPGKDGFPASKKYGNTTLNVGQLFGGVAPNVVAQNAQAIVTVRIGAGSPAKIEEIAKNALAPIAAYAESQGGSVALEFTGGGYPPVDMDCDVEGLDCITVNYGTDVPHLKVSKATKRYLYGPGTIFVAHGAKEAITVEELEDAVVGYKKLIYKGFGEEEESLR